MSNTEKLIKQLNENKEIRKLQEKVVKPAVRIVWPDLGDGYCNVGRRRIWTRIKRTFQRALSDPSGSRLRAYPGGEPCPTLDRSPYSAWNPQDPAGTMAQAVDDPGESHGWAVTPGRARASHRRNSPWRPSSRHVNGLGYAGAHNLPISGTPMACRQKGRTTVRAGGVKRRPDPNALSPQALRRPGSATSSPVPD
jgi:hypothetical protein